jgi:peptidoglycan/xylan/chitin deacetylase (PgdA/CDA1 family)
VEHGLYDVLQDSNGTLPFNPSEVIDNLRLERYARKSKTYRWQKNVYYALRPWLSPALRILVKKVQLRGWKNISFPEWPVDRTVENISEQLLLLSLQIHKTDRIPFVWFWPRGAQGCIMMTHDVERMAGRDACAQLMDLDDSFDIKASFEIVPEGRYDISPNLLDAIKRRGFEIGIHDLNHDGKLFDQRDEFLLRANKINQYAKQYGATTFRSAILYRQPEWYDALQLSCDMSIPNVAHLDPQRGGCCTVMPYFIGNVVELPVTTTQDYMLVHLLRQRNIDLWKEQTSMVLKKSGLVSFIVHSDDVMTGHVRPLYQDLLTYLQELRSSAHLWFALPREIDQWWRLRSKMFLVGDGESWKICGEGSDQAVVAYASSASGKLVYSIPS